MLNQGVAICQTATPWLNTSFVQNVIIFHSIQNILYTEPPFMNSGASNKPWSKTLIATCYFVQYAAQWLGLSLVSVHINLENFNTNMHHMINHMTAIFVLYAIQITLKVLKIPMYSPSLE